MDGRLAIALDVRTQGHTGRALVGPRFIWHTTTSGRRFSSQYHGSVALNGVRAVTGQIAYAWGPTTLLATVNGGTTWRPRYAGPAHLLSFTTSGPSGTGYLVTSQGLYVTRDAGAAWTACDHPAGIEEAAFVNSRQGWALAATDRVYRTENGARTWSLSFTLPDAHDADGQGGYGSGSLSVAAAASVWVVFAGGGGMSQQSYSVYHTADAGAHWQAVVAVATAGGGRAPGATDDASIGPKAGSAPGPLVAVGAHSALVFGVCRFCATTTGTVVVVKTSDGGLSWSGPAAIGQATGLPTMLDASFPTPGTGWLALAGESVGRSMILVTRDGGRTWHSVWRSPRT